MNKLIKPARIDEIIANGRVIRSRNELSEDLTGLWASSEYLKHLHKLEFNFRIHCGVRNKNLPAASRGYNPFNFMCDDVPYCAKCFLNANNYLNIHKYIKHRNHE